MQLLVCYIFISRMKRSGMYATVLIVAAYRKVGFEHPCINIVLIVTITSRDVPTYDCFSFIYNYKSITLKLVV